MPYRKSPEAWRCPLCHENHKLYHCPAHKEERANVVSAMRHRAVQDLTHVELPEEKTPLDNEIASGALQHAAVFGARIGTEALIKALEAEGVLQGQQCRRARYINESIVQTEVKNLIFTEIAAQFNFVQYYERAIDQQRRQPVLVAASSSSNQMDEEKQEDTPHPNKGRTQSYNQDEDAEHWEDYLFDKENPHTLQEDPHRYCS